MRMFNKALDTNPDVRPSRLRSNGGVWATVGSFVGMLPLLLDMLPKDKYVWVPAASALVAWLLKYVFGPPEYVPANPGGPSATELEKRIIELTAALEKKKEE